MLIQVLRKSVPSLGEALALGLITILAPIAGMISSQIALSYRTVILRADAVDGNGENVMAPHLRLAEVQRLVVTDLAVGGQSGLRLAG